MSGETEIAPSGWTTDTLSESMHRQVANLARSIDDRHIALRESLNERHNTDVNHIQQRFEAQEKAVETALTAAEKAVAAALAAQEKAVDKANVAAERRFESVNEFRAQLADQAGSFLTRTEADVRITALSEKVDDAVSRSRATLSELELRLTSRLDLTQGAMDGGGADAAAQRADRAERRAAVSQWIAASSLVLSVLVVTLGIAFNLAGR